MRAAWCGVDSQLFTMGVVDNFRLWGFPALGEVAHYRAGGNPLWFGYLELKEMQSTPSDAGEQQSHPWYVAHTRPRCEKKLVAWCGRAEHASELPTYVSVRKYRGKEATFHKPLFPGYVFLRLSIQGKREVMQSDYVANLLVPPDQVEFEAQLAVFCRRSKRWRMCGSCLTSAWARECLSSAARSRDLRRGWKTATARLRHCCGWISSDKLPR